MKKKVYAVALGILVALILAAIYSQVESNNNKIHYVSCQRPIVLIVNDIYEDIESGNIERAKAKLSKFNSLVNDTPPNHFWSNDSIVDILDTK
jgi:hypothetical protein